MAALRSHWNRMGRREMYFWLENQVKIRFSVSRSAVNWPKWGGSRRGSNWAPQFPAPCLLFVVAATVRRGAFVSWAQNGCERVDVCAECVGTDAPQKKNKWPTKRIVNALAVHIAPKSGWGPSLDTPKIIGKNCLGPFEWKWPAHQHLRRWCCWCYF